MRQGPHVARDKCSLLREYNRFIIIARYVNGGVLPSNGRKVWLSKRVHCAAISVCETSNVSIIFAQLVGERAKMKKVAVLLELKTVTERILKTIGSLERATLSRTIGLAAILFALSFGRPAAAAEPHWAFRAPVSPKIPAVSQAPLSNPIDRFLVAALRAKSLSFSQPADRRTLLRRVTFDLIGLPPTPPEVDAFLADHSPTAYEKVVDRLLADPRFGEKWARHWLDIAGYADSEGIL